MRLATLHVVAAAVVALPCFDAPAATPIEECYQSASGRQQVHACLERTDKEASDALAAALAAAQDRMQNLDRASGGGTAESALEASQQAFHSFRERNCAWVAATLSPGTGSEDAALDCIIRMTRARVDELMVAQDQPDAGGDAALTDVEWHLSALVFDGAATGLGSATDSEVSIRFEKSGRVFGRAPINRYAGSYTLNSDGRISWGDAGFQTTRMAGPPEAMEKEDMFLQILGQVYRFRISGSQLVLETEDSNSSLTFEH